MQPTTATTNTTIFANCPAPSHRDFVTKQSLCFIDNILLLCTKYLVRRRVVLIRVEPYSPRAALDRLSSEHFMQKPLVAGLVKLRHHL